MLGRKHRVTNEQFKECAENAHRYISKEHIDYKADIAKQYIADFCRSKNVAYAWSGGKDSIVLESLCKDAGIDHGLFVRCNLEYTSFLQWVDENKPNDVEVYNSGHDLNWLVENPQFLFPKGKLLFQWYYLYRNKSQNKWYKKNRLDVMCFGRRKIDGNNIGKDGIRIKRDGQVNFSPIYDWSHEEVFAYITYHKLSVPPIYEWEEGYNQGTHPWNELTEKNVNDNWRRIYAIEPEIVINASQYFDSAKKYLDSR